MLRIWLPLTKDLRQQGLSNVTVTNNGATFNSAGKLGGCYSFNGSSYITVQDVVLQNIWSYSCWLYSDVSSRSWEVVMACNINGGDADMQLGLYTRPGGNIIQNTANGQYNASIPMTYGQWNHFVGTFDGANLKTYLNGVLVNTKAITNAKLDRPKLTIGARCRGSSYDCYFQGLLNDIRIYDHCLSPMEVKELAKGLVLHYPLNRGGFGNENIIAGTKPTEQTYTYPSSSFQDKFAPITTVVPSGDKYTLSFYAKSTVVGDKIRAHYYSPNTTTTCVSSQGITKTASDGNMDFTLSTEWKLYWVTYTQTETTAVKHVILPRMGAVGNTSGIVSGTGTVSIKCLKLEAGDKPTPWCPNSSDALATTMGLNGTIEYDCSGFCNNGTRTGTFTWTSDTPKYEVSTVFNTGNRINCNTIPLIPEGQMTLAAWVYQTARSSSDRSIIMEWRGQYLTITSGGKLSGYSYGKSSAGYHDSTGIIPLNTWTHIACVWDSNSLKLYINGILDRTISCTGEFSNGRTDLSIGAESGNRLMNGYISDVRAYATALSASDVKSLYQNSAYIDSSGNVYGAVHSEV